MSFFDIQFFIFKLTSVWTPEFDSSWKLILYNIYSIIFMTSYGLYAVSLLLFLFINDCDVFILARNIFAVLIVFFILFHIVNVKRKKNKIIEISEIIKKTSYLPKNDDEKSIVSKYETINRKLFKYGIFLMSGLIFSCIGRVIKADFPVFPHYLWVPYDLSNPYYYWTTLFFITCSSVIGSVIGMQFASFFSSATFIIRSQIGLLIYRFRKTMKIIEEKINNDPSNIELKILERKLISDFVNNHLEVLKLAEMINDIFSIDFLILYSASTILICTHSYVLSKLPLLSKDFLTTVSFCVAVIYAITIICSRSNGISIAFEKLHHEITSANWIILGEKTKKSLMFVMIKTQKPFTFTTGKIVRPDRESLKNIAQVAYSLYNLMRTRS